MMSLVFGLLVVLAMIAVVACQALQRGAEIRRLMYDGVETTGTVLKKHAHRVRGGGRAWGVDYEFRDARGRLHRRHSMLEIESWKELQEGGAIGVWAART
jgi:hypothetical protein